MMDIHTKVGSKVIFAGKNGYIHELKEALKVLVPGKVYTVKLIDVGNWRSSVFLEEVDGARAFNTVMFENVDGLQEAADMAQRRG